MGSEIDEAANEKCSEYCELTIDFKGKDKKVFFNTERGKIMTGKETLSSEAVSRKQTKFILNA